MKSILMMLTLFLAMSTAAFAQGLDKVAVYVTGESDQGVSKVIGDQLVAAIVNSGKYKAIERTSSFLAELSKEHNFQRSGAVSDVQIAKLGENFGVQFVCVAEVSKVFGEKYISCRMVNVESAEIEQTANTRSPMSSMDELMDACAALAKGLTGGSVPTRRASNSKKSSGTTTTGQDYTETELGLDLKMVYVEGGSFLMGCTSEQSDCGSNEQNIRRVTLNSYYIGMFEVTQKQWELVMGTSIRQQMTKAGRTDLNGAGPDYPMYYVSWDEAMAFCQELSRLTGKTYTLPTEAQWEYAARGGVCNDKTKYSGSNVADLVAWYNENNDYTSKHSTHLVGTKRANGLGIYDMSGNVSEWCKDWYDSSYLSYETNNPEGPSSGSHRVDRGGSVLYGAEDCRVSYRGGFTPSYRNSIQGFRVVLIP